jgi:hypothetical protein
LKQQDNLQQLGKILSVLQIISKLGKFLFVDHFETAAQRQLGKIFICTGIRAELGAQIIVLREI